MYILRNHTTQVFLFIYIFLLLTVASCSAFAQETNSNATGRVMSEKKELLAGATITAIHEPTKNVFTTQSSSDGYFHFFNLKPGGPYTLLVSYTGFEIIKKKMYF